MLRRRLDSSGNNNEDPGSSPTILKKSDLDDYEPSERMQDTKMISKND